jgi:hypothetical protein
LFLFVENDETNDELAPSIVLTASDSVVGVGWLRRGKAF